MKKKIQNVVWGIFAFAFGGLWIYGGIKNLFFDPITENHKYNEIYPKLVGVLALALGIYLIYAWWKQAFMKGNNSGKT
ncbi:MAG: hypothetical protein HOD43_06285 [Candidatus Marinimicrobia bacterium]|nr:hypothetical protein [Candidatus Neomarinimicrobiota bacterium]MBT4994349.1 hypothetical protein [Candidatus Neomarinimicrobiota bacterium]